MSSNGVHWKRKTCLHLHRSWHTYAGARRAARAVAEGSCRTCHPYNSMLCTCCFLRPRRLPKYTNTVQMRRCICETQSALDDRLTLISASLLALRTNERSWFIPSPYCACFCICHTQRAARSQSPASCLLVKDLTAETPSMQALRYPSRLTSLSS